MHNLQGLGGTHPSITWKWFVMLFSLNAPSQTNEDVGQGMFPMKGLIF
jgi:hypothetical protein